MPPSLQRVPCPSPPRSGETGCRRVDDGPRPGCGKNGASHLVATSLRGAIVPVFVLPFAQQSIS